LSTIKDVVCRRRVPKVEWSAFNAQVHHQARQMKKGHLKVIQLFKNKKQSLNKYIL